MNSLSRIPPIKWAMVHPRLAAWIVLSLGMIILLVLEARDVGLLPLQWVALLIACVLVAGACVWIISWEDSDDADPTPEPETIPDKPLIESSEEAVTQVER